MTKEEKQLLLKDLCARLPYGVIVDYKENEFEIPHWKITTIYPDTFDGWIGCYKIVGAGSESGSRHFKIGELKPYLRPMSSMTEEEENEFISLNKIPSPCQLPNHTRMNWYSNATMIDWLNSHHFDYRGLIKRGLAIEAPKNMYKED